jgi:hypothetical protein
VESFLDNILNNASYDVLKWAVLAVLPVLFDLKKKIILLQNVTSNKKKLLSCDLLCQFLKKSPFALHFYNAYKKNSTCCILQHDEFKKSPVIYHL